MHKIIRKILGKFNIVIAFVMAVLLTGIIGAGTYVLASSTSEFQQTINSGTLSVDIVDGSYNSVSSPSVALDAATFSFGCQTVTTTSAFGTASEQIYVQNPDAADGGWTLTVAPANTTDVWDSAGTDFDFNDGSGCTDGADADSYGGQMAVDPSGATLDTGQCSSCTVTDITKGSYTAYVEGATDSATLLTAAAASDDIGDWTLQGVTIGVTIPAEQPAANDYTLNMVLTVTAS